jgi:hypothetical protein
MKPKAFIFEIKTPHTGRFMKKNPNLWKQAQQEVRQHWFINGQQLVYLQALYRLTTVRRTGLTVSRVVDSSPQGSPQTLASAGRRRGQRSNLLDSAR